MIVHPVLFEIGGFALHSFGAALALAFAVGIAVAMRRARRRGLDSEIVLEVSMVALATAMIGSRMLHVALHWSDFRPPDGGLLDIVVPRNPGGESRLSGFSAMGGLPTSALCSWAYLRIRKIDALSYMDVMAPSVALGAAITRMGCFLNGCCFGSVCPPSIGVHYPKASLAVQALGEVPVHAAPLYQVAMALAIFAALLWLQARNPFRGAIFFGLLIAMGAQRFAVEFVRFNTGQETLFVLGTWTISIYQAVGLGLVLVGVGGALFQRRRSAREALAA